METAEQKILEIKVKYDDAIRGIAAYRTELDKLKDSEAAYKKDLKDGNLSREQYNVKMAESKVATTQYSDAIRVLEKETQNNIKAEKSQQDSLVGLRASLNNLTRQYDEMSEAERKSASGQDLKIHINSVTDKLREAEEGTQRFYRNVGNYQSAFTQVLSPLKQKLDETKKAYFEMSDEERKGAKGEQMRTHIASINKELETTAGAAGKFQNEMLGMVGAQGGFISKAVQQANGLTSLGQAFTAARAGVMAFGQSLMSLLANPIVATLAGIALVIMSINKAMNSSKEITGRINILLAPLNFMMGALTGLLKLLVGYILDVVEGGAKMIGFFMGLMEKLPFVGKYIKDVNDGMRESIKLVEDTKKLGKMKREMIVQEATYERDIAELRLKAKQNDKYTLSQRKEFIDKAIEMESFLLSRKTAIAKAELDLAVRKAKESNKTDSDTLNDIEEKKAAIIRAEKEHADSVRGMMRERNGMLTKESNEQKQAAKAAEDATKERLAKQKEAMNKEREAIRQSEDALRSLIKDEAAKRKAEIIRTYAREIEDLKRKLNEDKSLTAKAKDAIRETIKAKEQQRINDLDKFNDEEIRKQIDHRQKLIEIQLAGVKAGTDQEFQLKMQSLIAQRDAELAQTDLTEQMKIAIRAKYNKQMDDLTDQHSNDVTQKQQDAIRTRFETEIEQAYGNEQEIARLNVEQKQAELDNIQQLEGEKTDAFNLRKLKVQNDYLSAKQDLAAKEVEIEQIKYQAAADITGALGQLAESAAAQSKEMAMASKILALAEIAINTGKAIAAGVAQAQSVPFPGNIAAIATTIATVISNIAVATKTVKSAKFADGGLVTGPGTGTSDSIPAHLSNGESVITARATEMFAPLLSSFNMMGGGVPISITQQSSQSMGEDMLARAVAKGMMMAPAPVVSVEEFTTVSNRVKVIEKTGSL